jgi:hypothetical protein
MIKPRLSMQIFTCVECRSEFRTARTHVMGKAIDAWWAGRGSRCTACLDKAAKTQPSYSTIEEEFWHFHKINFFVYDALVTEGRKLLARGHTRLGIGMLYERLRWQVFMETVDDDYDFKLPNNYRSHYARLIMKQEPDFAGVFQLAELRSTRRAT